MGNRFTYSDAGSILRMVEIEVYRLVYAGADPARTDALLGLANRLLSGEEQEVFHRYRPVRKKLEYVAGRALLRHVLEKIHGLPHARLTLADRGKPYVDGGGPHFNLSNSHEGILLVLSFDQEVGADLERLRPYTPGLEARVLLPDERARAASPETFFRYWTAKEAYMKLVGEGFNIRPLDLHYDLDRGLIRHRPDGDEARIAQAVEQGYVWAWCARTACRARERDVSLGDLLASSSGKQKS